MVGVGVVVDGPIHAGCEVVLKGSAPAPDGGRIRDVLFSVDADDCVLRRDAAKLVASLRPDGMGFAMGLAVDVASAPASPVRPPIAVQAVVDEAEPGRRIAFHDEHEARVHLAERTLAANVGIEPLIGDGGEVGACSVAIVGVAADAGPGGIVVLVAGLIGGFNDVEEVGEFAPDPWACVVLVGDA